MKKRRGAGHRGGRGMAGTGKRGDAKKPSIWKTKGYFKGPGFKGIHDRKMKPVNLLHIEQKLESLVKAGKVTSEGGFFVIDLSRLGFNRLLSKGSVTKRYKISCDYATPRAIQKVEKSGGTVTVPKKVE